MAKFTLKDSQQVEMTIAPKSAAGNPAPVQGKPTWESSAPDVLAVQASTDGMKAVAAAVGPLGPAQVTCRADADMGAGVKEIFMVQDFEVVGGDAVTLGIEVGEPIEKLEVNPLSGGTGKPAQKAPTPPPKK